jgi:hypothetical protein
MQSQRYFYQGSSKLYREFYRYDASLDRPNGYLWSFEEATKATLSMYGMPAAANTYASAIQDRFTARENYWDQSLTTERAYRSYPVTGDRYYDDNCWVGSDLLQHHLFTATAPTSTALDRAKAVFSYIQTGWTTNLPNAGGVRWVDASFNGDRATDSTAGWAKLGAHLYDATGRSTPAYRDTAIQAYTWLKTYLLRLQPNRGVLFHQNAQRCRGGRRRRSGEDHQPDDGVTPGGVRRAPDRRDLRLDGHVSRSGRRVPPLCPN